MNSGPKRTPTKLLQLRGSKWPGIQNRNEPAYAVKEPAKPDWLSPPAAQKWDELCARLLAVGVLTEGDGEVLGATCQVWSEWVELTKEIQTEGRYELQIESGRHFNHPRVTQRDRLWGEMIQGFAYFGLMPTERSKVQGNSPSDAGVPTRKRA